MRFLRSKIVAGVIACLVLLGVFALLVLRPSQPAQRPPADSGQGSGTVSGRLNGTAGTSSDDGDGAIRRTLVFTLESGPFWNRQATDFILTDSTLLMVNGRSLESSAVPAWGEIARAAMSNATVSYESSSGAPTSDAGYRLPVAVRVEIP